MALLDLRARRRDADRRAFCPLIVRMFLRSGQTRAGPLVLLGLVTFWLPLPIGLPLMLFGAAPGCP